LVFFFTNWFLRWADGPTDGDEVVRVHTYSGHENKAKLSLQDRVRQHGLAAEVWRCPDPDGYVVELVKGQKRSTTRKFFPGYIFVQMELDQETFPPGQETPRRFTRIPGWNNPQPVQRKPRIQNLHVAMTEARPGPSPEFRSRRRTVRVIDGPSANFTARWSRSTRKTEGEGERVHLRRATPVELDPRSRSLEN